MPMGVIIDVSCMLTGCLLGNLLKKHLKEQLCQRLTSIFGFCAMTMGISLIVKIDSTGPVVLSLILGTIIGEVFHLEDLVNRGISAAGSKLLGSGHNEEYRADFCTVAVLFCFSGPGLVGALMEGFAGDHSLLLAKAILDFFTAMIFSTQLGILLAIVALPQVLILLSMFLLSHILMPLFSAPVMGNFYAVGGAITLMAGINILKIVKVHVINSLPALLLIPVVTAFWPF